MDKNVLNDTIEKTHELLNAPSCSIEAKMAAKAWLEAVGTANETAETKRYISELEAAIMPIDSLISFTESTSGIQAFGAEMAGHIAAHAKKIKSAGAIYCDCPACTAVAAILDKKKDLLA